MTISPILPVYRRSDITMIRGEGCYLFDDAGKQYLDFATGIGVNALGHNHKQITEALKSQADELWHCSNLYMHPGIPKLAERIVADTFADTVFFCSTGTEAVECALKMARKHHHSAGRTERTRFITFGGGFHGRSFAGISAGGNEVARTGYAPLIPGFDKVAFNDLAATSAAITNETCAILVEPIQGEGGFCEASDEFLQGLRKLTDEHGILLIFDEVQCGLGRSGELLAHQKASIKPDIVTIAKAIGNGFPLAATLATEHAASGMTPGSHGSTYGANALAMAVGNAVWNVLTEADFTSRTQAAGEALGEGLAALQNKYPHIIQDVRGRCLMRGLLINKTSPKSHYDIAESLRHAGLLTAPAAGDGVIRLLPPLIIEQAHIDEAIHTIDDILSAL